MTLEELRDSFEESREKLEAEKLRILKQADNAYNEWRSANTKYTQKIQHWINEKNKKKLEKCKLLRSMNGELRDQRFENCLIDIRSQSGVKKVEYNAEGEPISIDFIGNPYPLLEEAIYPDMERSSYKEYNEKRLISKPCGLDKISRLLKKEDLEKRGITDRELECLVNVSVHEITFDSILKSGFFSQKDVERARKLFNNNEFFFKAVERYVNRTTVLRSIPVDIQTFKLDVDFEVDEKNETMTCREQLEKSEKREYKLTYKVTGAGKEWLKEALRNCAYTKSGKEMVILLLLLDSITPPEFRLIWRNDTTEGCAYYNNDNMIQLKDSEWEKIIGSGLLHEIGHYLQCCFGLTQTFESYRNTFAKKLLLLEYESKENRMFSVPQPLLNLFNEFEDVPDKNIQNNFNERDLFMRWQLISRWSQGFEISNILGVYFDQKDIYVNGLSQICHRKWTQYGHVYDCNLIREKLGAIEFDNSESKDVFENIIAKAKERRPEQYLLELLCKLHGLEFYKFVNTFDEIDSDDKLDVKEQRFKKVN